MEIVAYMKKLIIFASQECCGGMGDIAQLNSLFTVQSVAADVNTVAKAAKENGYESFVYMLHHYVDPENNRYLGKYVVDCAIVNDDGLSKVLSACDKAVFTGIPAMLGTIGAYIDRNYGNVWFDYKINGERNGQMGMLKYLLAEYGIPVVAVMSDTAGVAEAKTLFGNINTVVSVYNPYICPGGWQCCSAYPVAEMRAELTKAVSDALQSPATALDKTVLPLNVEIEYIRTDFCDVACAMNPKVERTGARTIRYSVDRLQSLDDLITRGEE
jgi:hypothetical protein